MDKLNSAEGDVTKLFDFKKRSQGMVPGLPDGMTTYWLNGRHAANTATVAVIQASVASVNNHGNHPLLGPGQDGSDRSMPPSSPDSMP